VANAPRPRRCLVNFRAPAGSWPRYGAGLRLREWLKLRVKDIDFGYGQIVVRDGKGAKDRVTMLLGHRSVETTMIYTHVMNKGGRGVASPLDRVAA